MNIPDTLEPVIASPHSQDAEEALLGSIIINADVYHDVASIIRADDFFILRNNWIYEAITRIAGRHEIIDYLTIIEELRRQGRLDNVGGAAYITYLGSNVATSIYGEAYAKIVQKASLRRRMLEGAAEMAHLARNEDMDADSALACAMGIFEKMIHQHSPNEWISIQDVASSYYDKVEKLYNKEIEAVGISTGLDDLDTKIRGSHKARLYILGARPGMGKTWAIIHLALQAARQGKRVGIVTMEMSAEDVQNRLVSLISGINSEKLEEGDLTESEWEIFVAANKEYEHLQIFIDASGYQTPRKMKANCTKLARRNGLDILFVDYLQLGTVDSDDKDKAEYNTVTKFSKALAALTKADALNIPIWAAAQLSRDVENRADKRPMMSDLRSSGQIEQDAAVIIFLYRDVVYNQTADAYVCEWIIAKNRFGGGKNRTGTVKTFYDFENPRFANLKTTKLNN